MYGTHFSAPPFNNLITRLFIAILLALPFQLFPQTFHCATADPDLALYRQMQRQIPDVLALGKREDIPENVVNIPVYFTVIRNDDGVIAFENCNLPGPISLSEADIDAAIVYLNDKVQETGFRLLRRRMY